MPDLNFPLDEHRHGDLFYAMQKAVYGSILSQADYAALSPEERAAVVQRMYRDQLERLRDAGWKRLLDDKFYQVARNCPPLGYHSKQQSYCCRLFFCPNCHGRSVFGNFWFRFRNLIFGRGLHDPLCCSVVEAYFREEHGLKGKIIDEAMKRMCFDHPEGARRELAGVKSIGSTVFQYPMLYKGRLTITRRTLLVLGRVRDPEYKHRVRVEITRNPATVDAITAIAARFCRYPAYYLRIEPSKMMLLIKLELDKQVKHTMYYGRLRGNDTRKLPRRR